MEEKYPKTLLKLSLNLLTKLTLDTIIKCCVKRQLKKCNCPPLTIYPNKRKRRNSELMENSFSSQSNLFEVRKRRKLNEEGNYEEPLQLNEELIYQENQMEYNLIRDQKELIKNGKTNLKENIVRDPVIIFRMYFKFFPSLLWAEFTTSILRELPKQTLLVHQQINRTVYELLFCSKLIRYSSSMNSRFPIGEQILVERLAFCRNLRKLDYAVPPICQDALKLQEEFLKALAKLRKLTSFSFTPSDTTIISAHSIFSVVINFQLLHQFSIFYDCGQMTEEVNVGCLKNCTNLQEVSLYSFGKGSEVDHVVYLLRNLKKLKFIYHRELPNALMHLHKETSNSVLEFKLKLESFTLVAPKKNFGNQLIYIPISTLLQVATLCPKLTCLTIIKPGNMLQVTNITPEMNCMTIHSCNFGEALKESVLTGRLINLQSLRLLNTETAVTYNDIVIISKGCPKIEELEIFNSNLVPSDIPAISDTENFLFPSLKKLILLSVEVHSCSEPFLITVSSQWTLGLQLTKLILKGSKALEVLYLEFSPMESLTMDRIRRDQLLPLLLESLNLKELLLWRCPSIDVAFVDTLAQRCPNLSRLRQINLWNFETPQDEVAIRKKYVYLLS